MSRLIDADKLIETLNELEIPFNAAINNIIISQPTAYDVDKVARHIEDLKEENFKRGIKENEPALLYASSCLHKALEIVRAGGIDEN